jgi:hypothetical protein
VKLKAETQFRLSHLMELTLFLLPGTRLSDFGSSPPVLPLADLLDTQTTCSPFRSQQTTDKLFLDPETVQSSSGTPLVTANSLSPRKVIPIGFLVYDSALTPKTLSLSAPAGTSLSR